MAVFEALICLYQFTRFGREADQEPLIFFFDDSSQKNGFVARRRVPGGLRLYILPSPPFSISLNPDSVIKIKQIVSKAGKKKKA